MDDNLKVKIAYNIIQDEVDFLFYMDSYDGRYLVMPMKFELKKREKDSLIKPTLSIPGNMAIIFMKSLAEALDGQGVKTENDFKLQGKIDSMNLHLEDMRKIAFKQLDIK